MAESSIGKVIEFLIGLLILPRMGTLIWIFAVPLFGFSAQMAIIASFVISLILIVMFFFIRKMIAFGLIIGTVIDIIGAYLALIG